MKPSDRQKILDKFGGRCAYCGVLPTGKLQVDHIIPKENFKRYVEKKRVPPFLKHLTVNDVNHIDNLFPACQPCNFYKSCMELETFRIELLKIWLRLYKTSFIYRTACRFNLIRTVNIETVDFHYEYYLAWIDGLNENAGMYIDYSKKIPDHLLK